MSPYYHAFLLSVISSFRRNDWIVFLNAYFDESCNSDGSVFVLSGYVFTKANAEKFSKEWSKYLKRVGLKYAHMVDCVHKAGEYAAFSPEKCDSIARTLVRMTKKYTDGSITASVNLKLYKEIFGPHDRSGRMTAYTMMLMALVKHLEQASTACGAKVMYIFEAGHSSMCEASQYFSFRNNPEMSAVLGGFNYTFVEKIYAPPLQCADMLAWHNQKYLTDKMKKGKTEPRADFRALTRDTDLTIEILPSDLAIMRKNIDRFLDCIERDDRPGFIAIAEEILLGRSPS